MFHLDIIYSYQILCNMREPHLVQLTLYIITRPRIPMQQLVPTAEYSAPGETLSFHPGDGPHTTNGETTKISDIVVNAGGEDRDRATEPKDTSLGHLRARLTTLQDQINIFLTEKMAQEKNQDDDIERRILDEGCEVESDDETSDNLDTAN